MTCRTFEAKAFELPGNLQASDGNKLSLLRMMGSLPSKGKPLPNPSLHPSVRGQRPVPLQAERTKATAVALGSFPAGEQAELSLRLGEPLTIISENGDWWTVLSEVSGKEYNVPSVHVARLSQGWLYKGLSREKAEELLLLPGNPGGAFLIRESQTRKGCYSLSVRLSRPASWDQIRHYRIQHLDNGWLYISPSLTFPSLQALVDHYSELADGICCLLKEPCVLQKSGLLPGKDTPQPMAVQRTMLNWKELDSSSLFLEAPASGGASLLSEGLRESLSSYISLSEGISLDDKAKSRGRKRDQGWST
ncbi:src-like-adapter 2 [Perognathus longimembris pacificus]|uniref:src-like-adapter 2 n=1 Tax=Perognathus longimembris pacificus TaxID=214514 RepID=UPI002019FDB7|nr:src-like-adapter 2 [Perognathus longimembris pacificus]